LTITLAAYRIKHPMPDESPKVVETAVGVVPQPTEPALETTVTPPSDPVGEVVTAEQAPAWQAAVDRIGDMLGTANELMHNGPGDCIEFMESVTAAATEMRGWIKEREHVTADQEGAIEGWAEGIAKWQPKS
jgi:DNA-directed RNA polymerase subunit L